MKVLVLAGGYDQIALINELSNRGHYVILADYLDNPPAKCVAKQHFQVSTLDEEAVFQLAKAEQVDLITTACTDQALITVARVSERLNLPCYVSAETAQNVTNKRFMKKKFMELGIPTSKYIVVNSLEQINVDDFTFPIVLKPVDCNSSKGVLKVYSKEDLEEKFYLALKESRSEYVVLEEYKSGKELSIDVFVRNGCVEILSSRELIKIKNRDSFTIVQGILPPNVSECVELKIKSIAGLIAKGFNLINSPMLIQLIVDDDENVFVLEFSARMGGGSKYKTIEFVTGINIMEQYVNLILNKEVNLEKTDTVPFARMNYCYARPGVYHHVEGIEELKERGVIQDYFIYKTQGSKIEKNTTSTDRILGFFIASKSKLELLELEKMAINKIKIIDTNGEDMFDRTLGYNNNEI